MINYGIIWVIMPKRRSKRSQRMYLTLVYMTMTILVVCVVGLLMLLTLGYDFNTKSGRIEQGGLIQLESRPTGATVIFDGQRLSSVTNTKVTASSGTHSVTMQRSGYRDWQKQISLHHGEVLWFNYVLLVPTNITTQTIAQYTESTTSLASRTAKWLIIARHNSPALERYDLAREDAKMTPITIPADSYTAPATSKSQVFEPVMWMNDNRTLVVRHTYDEGMVEWLTMDVENVASTRNLTKQLGIQVVQLQPNASDANRIYVVTATHELREIKLSEMSLSRVIAERVASISPGDSGTITYQTLPDDKSQRTIGYVTDGTMKPRVIMTTESPGHLTALISKYYGDHYITTIEGEKMTIAKVSLPSSDSSASYQTTPVASVIAPASASLSHNISQRFVLAQNPSGFAVYDLELQKYTTTSFEGNQTTPLRWIDAHHLTAARDGSLKLYEFDGTNIQTLAGDTASGAVTFARDGKYLYYIARGEGAMQRLTRLTMILD